MEIKNLEYLLYESDEAPIGLPDGVVFIDEKKSIEITKITDNLIQLYKKNKFIKVNPPIFEYYETFEKGSGNQIARKSFSFKDKDGKLLTLRYDMTTPIARMVAMKYNEKDLPLKFCYNADVFREQPLYAGKPRQFRQIGTEYIGSSEIESDIEIINLLGYSLEEIDKKYTIVIGDLRIYKHILGHFKLTPLQNEAINAAMVLKDSVSLKKILESVDGIKEYKDFLIRLIEMNGSIKDIRSALQEFSDLGFNIYTDRLFEIIKQIDPEVKKRVMIDLSLIKDFQYYTSITLEGYIESSGVAIASGGRYDDLLVKFGKNFPAVGFAVNMNFFI